MILWLLWAALLLAQNYTFTYVSRARNGENLREHLKAALMSNGVWFLQQIVGVVQIVTFYRNGQYVALTFAGAWYTIWTVIGSLTAHYILVQKKRGNTVFSVRGVVSGIMHELRYPPSVRTASSSLSSPK